MSALEPGALGMRIREVRTSRGVSLRELARRLGVSPATLSAIENGHTNVSVLRTGQIADELQVSLSDLLSATPLFGAAQMTRPTGQRDPYVNGSDWRAFPPLQLDPALAAALATFLELGYHGATVRMIARRAKLSVPGIYHHYKNKQAMLISILEITMDELLARSRAALAEGKDPVERFSLLIECLVLYHTHRRELGFVGASEMRSLEPSARIQVAAARTSQQRMLDEQVLAGCALGVFSTERPREAARAVVTMCTGVAQWFQPGGPAKPDEIAQHYVDFALALVGHKPEKSPQRE
jgi:AcrR family transcriptional regulator